MDPRRAIFSLWTDPKLEGKRRLVEEHLSRQNLTKAIEGAGFTHFKCGVCNATNSMLALDLLWVIATYPEHFLYEGEIVVCIPCMDDISRRQILVAKRKWSENYLSLCYSTPKFMSRYIYNPLHNYYMLLEKYHISEKMKHTYDIVFRAECPTRNPFFQIDNTLFTILSVTHL